jgi:hypothetical protein
VAGSPGTEVQSFELTSAQYAITVCLIQWDDEPGMKDKKGTPKPVPLPDLVLLVNQAGSAEACFRTKVHALDDPV